MNAPNFFQTAAWFDVLNKGFGARGRRMNDALAATLFRFGPLGLAYANFPVGIRTPEALEAVMRPETWRALKEMGGDLLRFSVPESLAQALGGNGGSLPETCIQNLADWSEEGLGSDVRYEIRRSRREGILIRPSRLSDARFMFELYRITVERHEGRLRYTPSYFAALCQLAQSAPDISGLIAETSERMPCGFVITAQSGEETYYLHAAFSQAHASGRPSYALLCSAITEARNNGRRRFNLMASPASQPSLVRFKEKWGGQTRPLLNFDIPISRLGNLTRLALQVRQRWSRVGRD